MLRKETGLYLHQPQMLTFRAGIFLLLRNEKAKLFLNIFIVGAEAEMSSVIFSALDIRIIIRS